MRSAVDEVGRVLIEEGIDAGFTKGGTVIAARTPAQRDRLRSSLSADETWLDASQAAERIGVSDLYGATFNPHCATVHPGRAVHGLAAAVEARGVQIFERTAATAFESSRVVTDHSTITATTVLRCTEAYTASLRSTKRRIAPVYSLMIATEPLPPSFWAAAKLHQRETFSDGRHVVIYGQRTADDRIAFGGRGAPYHFGSVIQDRFDHEPTVFASLEVTLREMFPMLDGYAITHRWGGPLGIPRDWMASVEFDRDRKVGSAGGYVGDGVSTTNLAGRTLARLTLGIEDDLTALPWVHHHSPNWEPEPLRWLGINLGTRLAATADSREPNGGLRHQIASAALRRLTGGH
jgi:glycine/D-amino acid oxidase-like deaminating enzyme